MPKIVFSLTAHENIECVYDLIDNIKKCFVQYDITILISMTESLYSVFNNTYDFVKIVTCRPDTMPVWGHINLFHQHMLNMKYICENNINYDVFWFIASNEMFIKIIPPDFLNNCLQIIDKKDPDLDYDVYYNDFIKTTHTWPTFDLCKLDTPVINYFYKNKFKIHPLQHEGLVIPSTIMLEIFQEYSNNMLWEQSTYEYYGIEEIFVSTYIINKYNTVNFPKNHCFQYRWTLGENVEYEQIEKHMVDTHVSIKPVKRIYDDTLRTHIRNNIK